MVVGVPLSVLGRDIAPPSSLQEVFIRRRAPLRVPVARPQTLCAAPSRSSPQKVRSSMSWPKLGVDHMRRPGLAIQRQNHCTESGSTLIMHMQKSSKRHLACSFLSAVSAAVTLWSTISMYTQTISLNCIWCGATVYTTFGLYHSIHTLASSPVPCTNVPTQLWPVSLPCMQTWPVRPDATVSPCTHS